MSDDIVAAFVKDINASDYNLRDENDPVSSKDNAGWKEETKDDTEESKDDAVESFFVIVYSIKKYQYYKIQST